MRSKKEKIKLDATIRNVLKDNTFVVALRNGHPVLAFQRAGRSGTGESRERVVGEKVVVEMMPGDMTQGQLVTTF